ncbi:MAG TPA: hypothetical protein VGS09_10060 [Actinomycetota bacterium]|jgi:hypothetical protein|nr:hypothetical protein [Actinomycetota bacterium]
MSAATELNEAERALVGSYRALERVLREQGDQLPPFAHRNAAKALAALWQVMNGLDQDPGQLYELGA